MTLSERRNEAGAKGRARPPAVAGFDVNASGVPAARRASAALREWYVRRGPPLETMDWDEYGAMVEAVVAAMGERPPLRRFVYRHRLAHQDTDMGVGKPYAVRLCYADPGGSGEPVIAVGGIINVLQRFDFLALDAAPSLRIIALDYAGRGRSGWLAEVSDYHLDSYVEQIVQLMDHLGLESCTLLGSSLGGSAAVRLAARNPGRVRRIVLNDSAPYIPAARRARRARAVARHYVFRDPAEMLRRSAAAEKNGGPVPDAVLLHTAHHRTRWSDDEDGRVYRHDLRALLAYRNEAGSALDLWDDWQAVKCPVLLLRGMLSDATSEESVDRMRRRGGLSVIRVSDTGHTPSLSDSALTERLVEWIGDDRPFDEDRVHRPVAEGKVFHEAR